MSKPPRKLTALGGKEQKLYRQLAQRDADVLAERARTENAEAAKAKAIALGVASVEKEAAKTDKVRASRGRARPIYFIAGIAAGHGWLPVWAFLIERIT